MSSENGGTEISRGRRRDLGPFAPDQDAAVETAATPLWREGAFMAERMCLHLSPVFYGFGVPRGEGQPVMVIPPFLGSDLMLLDMRIWLKRIGYRPHRSHIVFNSDCPEETAQTLTRRVRSIYGRSRVKLRLIGHSLGGSLARSVALRIPEVVDRVITLGSPVRETARAHPVAMGLMSTLREIDHGLIARNMGPACATGHCMCAFSRTMGSVSGAVPFFSIYSPTDGVVTADSCILEDESRNTAVDATHIGLAFNQHAYRALGARLAEVQ